MANYFIIYGLIAVASLGLVLLLGLLRGRKRSRRRQNRLGVAFERARIVERTGSGLQGTPYSVYGESSWSDHTHSGR
tara:strand:+ start:53 stop:283 length:231 start_codon:yes stop_codon:yes gene_type:complete